MANIPRGGNPALQVYNGCLAAQLASSVTCASRGCLDFFFEQETILVLTLVLAGDSGAPIIYAES